MSKSDNIEDAKKVSSEEKQNPTYIKKGNALDVDAQKDTKDIAKEMQMKNIIMQLKPDTFRGIINVKVNPSVNIGKSLNSAEIKKPLINKNTPSFDRIKSSNPKDKDKGNSR